MNLEYTIDLDGLDFVKAVTNYSSLVDHRLAHRDKLSLKIRFTRAGVCQDVGTIASAHYTVKKINEDEEVLSDDSTVTTWTKTTSGTDIYYTHDGVIDLDTVELETWIGSQQTCKAEVQFSWTIGTQVYHTRLLKTTIDRALYPATVNPTQATDPQRSWVTILQDVDKLAGDASGSVTLESVTTVGLQVPRWYQFLRATDGILYYFKLRAGTDANSGDDIRRPDDYHAVTNAKVFDQQVIAYSGGTNLTDSATATTITIASDVGTDAVLEAPTATSAGIMVASEMGVVNLGDAALSGTVTFAGTFASAPTKIFLSIEISASGGSPTGTSTLLFANYHSVTTTGFKWELSGATGDANHKLVWWAIR